MQTLEPVAGLLPRGMQATQRFLQYNLVTKAQFDVAGRDMTQLRAVHTVALEDRVCKLVVGELYHHTRLLGK